MEVSLIRKREGEVPVQREQPDLMLLDRVMFPLDFLNVFITGKSRACCVPTLVLEPDQKAEPFWRLDVTAHDGSA